MPLVGDQAAAITGGGDGLKDRFAEHPPLDIIGKYERDEVKPSVEVAAKIADALEVSLDFLVGKTNVEIDAKALKRLQDIQKLNDNDKATVFEMVDAFLRDRKAKKAYAS